MNVFEFVDMDCVLREALDGIHLAVDGWLGGLPTNEESLMNRLTEQFTRRRRHCDVGVRAPVEMTANVALLHRKGERQTDAFGADLAVTVDIPGNQYRKAVLLQLKISEAFSTRLEREQIQQALDDGRTAERSFVVVMEKVRRRMRVMRSKEAIELLGEGNRTAEVSCAGWMTASEWLKKWISCEVGQPSKHDDPQSVERLLQGFVVESPSGWESPWGSGEQGAFPGGRLPANAWLEMIFRQPASAGRNQ